MAAWDADGVRGVLVLVVVVGCRAGFDPIDRRGDAGSGDAGPDAAPGLCADPACLAAGGACIANTCVIIQIGEGARTCPAGMPCRIECTGTERPCRDGASCGEATICELRCIGDRACQDGASCGTASTCTVTCDGEEACEEGISAGPGTACTSHCCGTEACSSGVGSCTTDAICN